MKALWGQGLPAMLQAMVEHDCLGIVQDIVAGLPERTS